VEPKNELGEQQMKARYAGIIGAALVSVCSAAQAAQPAQPAQPIGCIIEPDVVTEVGSPVVGIIQTIVSRGDWVRKGQVIALLRNDVDQAALTVAQSRAAADSEEKAALANHAFAQQRRVRAEELLRKEFISKQALDQAIAEDEVARQKLLQAREQRQIAVREASLAKIRLEERTIRSPLDGIIVERYVTPGERVDEKPLVRVARIDPLRVEAILQSTMFGSIATGAQASIMPEMPNATAVTARVVLVDKVLDAASGTFRVRMQLPNPGRSIPAGLRCKVDFAGFASPDKLKSANIPDAGVSVAPVPKAGTASGLIRVPLARDK
jgi:RND family efflux transporter MFP subunit